MTAQKLTKHSWRTEEPLMSADMTAIGKTINDIIDDITSLTPSSPNTNGLTIDDVNNAITAYYRSVIEGAISQLNSNLGEALRRLTNLERNGYGNEGNDTYDLEWLKNDIGAIFRYMGITKDEETGLYTYSLDMGSIANVDNLGLAIAALQTSVNNNGDAIAGLTAGIIAGYDEHNNPIYKFDPAQIILAINSSGDTIGKIKADYIELDGYVKASDIEAKYIEVEQLGSIENQVKTAVISELNVPTKAEIKEAVITDLEAGNVTITGDLRYNRIIGNVDIVSTTQQLSDDAYFVHINNSTTNTIIVTLPQNPVDGQTLFIECGNKYFELRANKDIRYYRRVFNGLNTNIKYSIYTGYYTANDTPGVNAKTYEWNGVVEFIYSQNGEYWQQLIHNIDITEA